MNDNDDSRTVSRRLFLGAVGAGTVALAGCASGSGGDPQVDHEAPVRGDPNADVTLEVYEDFSCPHCRTFNMQDLPALAQQYLEPGQIRYEHRDFPFLDDQSWQAANAAREVYLEHGDEAFWEYKSTVFARQGDLGTGAPEIFGEIASELEFDLDAEAIQSAATDRPHDSILEDDKSRGESQGVSGTPSFVLDGELVEDDLTAEIDAKIN
ncbi:MAG: thioredoxin domain-containing protein [Halovenus sp.]